MTSLSHPPTASALDTVEALNRQCYCRTLNLEHLRRQLENDSNLSGLTEEIFRTRPHLFAATAVFITRDMADAIAATIAAIEQVIALPAFRAMALSHAPAIARHDFGPAGVFMGYDFHLGSSGPRLIEINTNAGGALLNAALARAQHACCAEMDWAFAPNAALPRLEQIFCDMFAGEWRRQRGNAPIGSLFIVDDDPAKQYLAPEFQLFQQMFQRHGIAASIADPKAFDWRDGRLWHGTTPVDIVYNRLTDFYLAEDHHRALRLAYEAGATVLTPHPRAHAFYADKRNLVALSDDAMLAGWGVPEDERHLLQAAIPRTEIVMPENADALWARRHALFFKPFASYGAKAAYRGDKLTRRVWSEIQRGGFVAQALVPPRERVIEVDGHPADLKFDIRAYTYCGQVQLLAARMYAGQTTNFRTPGGGFAPVIVAP